MTSGASSSGITSRGTIGTPSVPELSRIARLTDPLFFAEDPHPVFARLRREAPVHWCEEGEFWAVTTYEDVRRVGSSPDQFSSGRGTLISDSRARDAGGPHLPGARHLLRADPPLHSAMRRIVSRSFTPRAIAQLEPQVRSIAGTVLGAIDGSELRNAVEAVSAPLTTYVIAELMGVPRERWPEFWRWTDSAILQVDAGPDDEALATGVGELLEFFDELCQERRRHPGDDIVSQLVTGNVEGQPLDRTDLLTFCKFLLVAGTETTRNLVSWGMALLAEHPEQRAHLVRHPDAIGDAVEEMLRFASPVIAFGRTAVVDLTIRDQLIRAGDYVVMFYPSANRDETIWERADVFDIRRDRSAPHVAFGFGPHVCLGAPLARMETRVLFEELLQRFPNYEVVGRPVQHASTLVAMVTDLPVRFGGPTGG